MAFRFGLILCGVWLVTLAGIACKGAQTVSPAAFYQWIEGESPTSIALGSVKPTIAGWGHSEFLSGNKWLQISVDADKVDSQLPKEGALLTYALNVPAAGEYSLWDRIGYEFVRSPFEWRIDDGAWTTVSPDTLTTDLMELADWNEVAWLRLGSQNLSAGAHTLTIRLPRTVDKDGKPARVLYASDALCVTSGTFTPDGPRKPDAPAESANRVPFELPAPKGLSNGWRVTIPLSGQWEICRADEQAPPFDIAQPMTKADMPAIAHWKPIAVPGDKNTLRPDLLMAHRVWYRTSVNVDPAFANRSFVLHFGQNNLNTTVFVNGVYCGFNKNPFAPFDIDVTKGMKPGQNEVWVGIRDAWYGRSGNPKDPMKLRRTFNLPLRLGGEGFQDLAYPIWNHFESGILATPTLTAAGAVYISDVFVQPSVAKKQVAAQVTLTNTTGKAVSGELSGYSFPPKPQRDERSILNLARTPYQLAPGESKAYTLTGNAEGLKLWWPDDPNLYKLTVEVSDNDTKTLDQSDTTFGYREWGTKGDATGAVQFTLNGIVWHGWATLDEDLKPAEYLKWYHNTHQKMMRYWGTTWKGMEPSAALAFFDQNGVVVRRSGMLDGEAIGNNAIENDPDLKALYKSPIKMDLMHNWRDQMVAQVKGERNHPSVMIWSIENEWLYINCINLYGNLMDDFEREVKITSDAVREADPTRLNMTDGGGANKANDMPVHGNHYVFSGTTEPGRYPDLAYQPNPDGGGRGRWHWDGKRPRFIGEDYFATGINPFDYAFVGGEVTFQGKAQSRTAAAVLTRMLTEGYRWTGYSAWHFWLGESAVTLDYSRSFAPVAVFCREYDWSFGSGQRVLRTLGIFNDMHNATPIVLTQTLTVGGKVISRAVSTHNVAPGGNSKFPVTLALPAVATRQEGTWTLTLTQGGKTVYSDSKAVSVLPAARFALSPVQIAGRGRLAPAVAPLLVYDPKNAVLPLLRAQRVPVQAVRSLHLPAQGKVLLIGPNALTDRESTSSNLAAWASEGRSIIVLEQAHPLHYQAVPAELETTEATGKFAFAEDLQHPALRGLQQKDFFTWGGGGGNGGDGVVYRQAYSKPTRGGRSLVQCDVRLSDSALVEVPVGSGVLLLSQLTIGEKAATNAVAARLLGNLLAYAQTYRQEFRPTVALLGGAGKPFVNALEATGAKYTAITGDDVSAALAKPATRLMIVEATPAHLHALAQNKQAVQAYTNRGGWLFFHGLTPEGLTDYNKLVGFDHMIRPFRRERVNFGPTRHPLTSGLTLGDIVMLSGERIFGYTDDKYVASDIYSYVVDYDEVAPFAKLPDDYSYNTVNGFVSADAWKYIYSFDLNSKPNPVLPYALPKAQEITELEWVGNTFYHLVTNVELTFDGKNPVSLATKPNNEPQTFTIAPGHVGKTITLRIADWQRRPEKGANVVGIDNIRMKAKRPASFYQRVHPLLNVGGLMQYDSGTPGKPSGGGMVLCNLLFKDREEVAENATKKQTILATLLRNLKAPFAGSRTVIAGARLAYTPVDLAGKANQYRDERGWFGDKNFTFAALPSGRQVLANVPFQVYDFKTSPVPTVVMLGANGIPNNLPDAVRGIVVNRKADALFFLQAARMDNRRNRDELRDKKRYEMARYVVHYADGKIERVPVYAEIDVDDYRQKTPTALSGAQVGWTSPYAGGDSSAVAYVQQWNNPHPDVPIASVDLEYGPDRRGVPALLALTTATTLRQ